MEDKNPIKLSLINLLGIILIVGIVIGVTFFINSIKTFSNVSNGGDNLYVEQFDDNITNTTKKSTNNNMESNSSNSLNKTSNTSNNKKQNTYIKK